MTALQSAAFNLSRFLAKNVPPGDAIGTHQEEDWSISLVAHGEEPAEELMALLQAQENALKAEGLDPTA